LLASLYPYTTLFRSTKFTINSNVNKLKAIGVIGASGKTPCKYCAKEIAYIANVICINVNMHSQNTPIFGDNNRLVYLYKPPVVGSVPPKIAIGDIAIIPSNEEII